MQKSLKMSAPCILGIEGILAEELRNLGADNVAAQNGKVNFEGNFNILAKANISSRYAERIHIVLGSFKALSFEELFENVKKIPWENFIGKNDCFPVKGFSLNSKLHSVPDCQAIIKKSIVNRLKTCYKEEWFKETGSLYQIKFSIMKDQVDIMIDSTGTGLHKRGYRPDANEAPIKETLAAAMAYLAHVKHYSTVIDPFCGSGTILIESAMLALNIAPGLRRTFVSETWANIDKNIWTEERALAVSQIRKDTEFKAVGYDNNERSVHLSKLNIKRAGLDKKIEIIEKDFNDFKCDEEKAIIICNPPYGERMLELKEAENIYKLMGEKFIKRKGLSYYIINPHEDFESLYGCKADRRRKLYNGMIKCQLYMYFK